MLHAGDLVVRIGIGVVIVVISLLSGACAGVNGGEVITREEFEDRRILAVAVTTERCSNEVGIGTQDKGAMVVLAESLRLGSQSLMSVQFPKDLGQSYVTDEDANLCVISILALPCSDDWIGDMLLANTLYCNPKRASLWQNQHFGQGEWSVPEGGPRF